MPTISPRDVPLIREHLVRHLTDTRFLHNAHLVDDPAGDLGFAVRVLLSWLPTAQLWFTNDDMSEVVWGSADSLPDYTLDTEDALRCPNGLWVLDFMVDDVEPKGIIPLLQWFYVPPGAFPSEVLATDERAAAWNRGGFVVVSYRWYARADSLALGEVGFWPIGYSITDMVDDAGDYNRGVDPENQARLYRTVRLLATLWAFIDSPRVTDIADAPFDRAARRRAERVSHGTGPVRVLYLRRPAAGSTSGQPDAGREFSHRWVVGGHWRKQRVGAGRKLVRPVYIAPYIKGPAGAPLDTRTTVRALTK